MRGTLTERLKAKIAIKGVDDCWEWTAGKGTDGYGRIRINGYSENVTRVIYRAFKGEIPVGFVVMHTCDNPGCCNPKHLEAGTQQDNMKQCETRGRFASTKGTLNGRAKITEDQVRELRQKVRNGGIVIEDVAKELNVSYSTIWGIVKNVTWKHVT